MSTTLAWLEPPNEGRRVWAVLSTERQRAVVQREPEQRGDHAAFVARLSPAADSGYGAGV
ncbi:hypothetical protein [Streptomyces laurentii]|uniref:hypothetical protein n=1 Tax=Streptomyces laurentii TaxID=39478 RepID=UPI0036A3CE29